MKNLFKRSPNLIEQARTLALSVRSSLGDFELDDPRLDWFQTELESLDRFGSVDGNIGIADLNEVSATIAGLQQLQYLIQQHAKNAGDPESHGSIWQMPVSYRTEQARLPAFVVDAALRYGCSIEPVLLHDPAINNEEFDPVSPTAKITAYLRSLDSSDEIHQLFGLAEEGRVIADEMGITDPTTLHLMATLFLCRHYAFNALLTQRQNASSQIIEFAAGISPRGYQWSRSVSKTIYVESDLPVLMVRKAKMVRDACMDLKIPHRGMHHCRAIDVLDLHSVTAAVRSLDTTVPFTIVTEGLLLYFNKKELERFLANIRSLLRDYPNATWVTDFVPKQAFGNVSKAAPDVAAAMKNVFANVGRNVIAENPFCDNDDVVKQLKESNLVANAQIRLSDMLDRVSLSQSLDRSIQSAMLGDRMVCKIGFEVLR